MSQVTRCPACGTSFRVVPDQLRISQGWVRCGQCAEIFDASLELRDPGTAAAPLRPQPPSSFEPLPDQDGPAPDQAWPAPAEPAVPTWPEPDAGVGPEHGVSTPTLVDLAPQWLQSAPPDIPVTDPAASLDVGFAEYRQAQVQAEEAALSAQAHAVSPAASHTAEVAPVDLVDTAPPPPSTDAPGAERLYPALARETTAQDPGKAAGAALGAMPLPQRPAAEPSTPSVARAPASYRPTRAAPVVDPAHAELSFLRETPVAAAVPARAKRKPLWFGVLAVSVLVLLLQWALHERDRLASAAPALRPVLQALCAPLRCTVQPLRRIDAIVIDGSAFVALGEQGYRLSLTLRNRASHAVALPAVVLALTDIQEQAVVRRVLLPTELGDPPPALPAHGEWSTSVDLQLADNAGRARVVGYRLDAFYP